MKSLLGCILFLAFPIVLSAQMGESGLTAHDTLSVSIPAPVPVKGEITFPNAFRWNKTGPTGGYWNESQSGDYVFRPVFRNVAEYRLRIFNRSGKLVYSSTDIHKGWDGYIENGQLSLQGVYIWRADGKFFDGSAFSMAGDVTFLH